MSTNSQAMHEIARQVALSRWRGGGTESHRRPDSARVCVVRPTADSSPRSRKDRQGAEDD